MTCLSQATAAPVFKKPIICPEENWAQTQKPEWKPLMELLFHVRARHKYYAQIERMKG